MADTITSNPFRVMSREKDVVLRFGRFYPNGSSAVDNSANIGLKNMTVTRTGVGTYDIVFANSNSVWRALGVFGSVALATPLPYTVRRDSSLDDGTGFSIAVFDEAGLAVDIAASSGSWIDLVMSFQLSETI